MCGLLSLLSPLQLLRKETEKNNFIEAQIFWNGIGKLELEGQIKPLTFANKVLLECGHPH